jgi:hypothetical protein
MRAIILAMHLLRLTGPDHQVIDINPAGIVSLRQPRGSETQHFHKDVKCLIHTADGKFIAVIEKCDTVRDQLESKNDG